MAVLAAACSSEPCDDGALFSPCPDCGPGEVRAGVATHESRSRAEVRPGGGIARVSCDTRLIRHDAAFAVDGEVGLYVQGSPALQAVGADDSVLVVDRALDDLDTDDLVAVATSGTEMWRIPTGADKVWLAPAGDAVIAFGRASEALVFGDFTVQGLFAVAVGAADGQARWAWSSPQGVDASIWAAGAADGSVVVVGVFDGALELGGTTAPLNAGGPTGFVGLLDASGAGVWSRQLIGPAQSAAVTVARGGDGSIAIVGHYSGGSLDLDSVVLRPEAELSDQFVAVLEPTGATRWAVNLGDWIAEPISAIAVAGGSVVLGGRHADALSFGSDTVPQEIDAYIVSLTGGTINWVVQIGGPATQAISGLGWNGALHASVDQWSAEGDPSASLEFRDASLEGDGALHLELGP